VSEVSPWSSDDSPYAADWFDVTNTGTRAIGITGWKMDDNSNSFGSAVALNGVGTIAAGQPVIFIEGDATAAAKFKTAWFGSDVPSGFKTGAYGGAGVGLSTGGDAVNLFDALGNRVTGVSFGTSTTFFTFDNTAGLAGKTLPLPAVSTLSVVGSNGAYRAGQRPARPARPRRARPRRPSPTAATRARTRSTSRSASPCAAAADPRGSGIASTTCADVTGPAAGFGLGAHPSVRPPPTNAGNAGSGSGSFTVTVTPASLCSLTKTYAHCSATCQSLTATQNPAFDKTLVALCEADLTRSSRASRRPRRRR
jgi:hypothetical protein